MSTNRIRVVIVRGIHIINYMLWAFSVSKTPALRSSVVCHAPPSQRNEPLQVCFKTIDLPSIHHPISQDYHRHPDEIPVRIPNPPYLARKTRLSYPRNPLLSLASNSTFLHSHSISLPHWYHASFLAVRTFGLPKPPQPAIQHHPSLPDPTHISSTSTIPPTPAKPAASHLSLQTPPCGDSCRCRLQCTAAACCLTRGACMSRPFWWDIAALQVVVVVVVEVSVLVLVLWMLVGMLLWML